MKTKELDTLKTQKHQVGLIKGNFSPAEAGEILEALIDQKIKFHEVRKFQRWVSDHNCVTSDLETRIEELKSEKFMVKQFINELMDTDKCISINGLVNVEVKDRQE